MMYKVHTASPAYFFLCMMVVVLIGLWASYKEDKNGRRR